ncbi:MAG: hypothetical protein PHZ11_09930 [Desulfitobacteriaceae bacterium]|nr:hypothetical protein [Desulfitobacteriaceae bacterium]
MLMRAPTPEMVENWKRIWIEYKDKLLPNRKSGAEVVDYLTNKYPLRELHDDKATQVVLDNVVYNKPFADKLPIGADPSAVTFIVKNTGTGKVLYKNQDKIFKGNSIFVGIDLNSGYYCVEGSSMLWDELCAFQGLDKSDLQNYYRVAEYISCLKRFGLMENK